MLSLTLIGPVLVLLVSYGIYRLLRVGKRDPRLPPGPPTVPILGNVHQIPETGLGKKFQEWSKEYGSVYSLKVFNGTWIVLADRKSVSQLLDKKGSIYSDRPPLPIPLFMSRNAHMTMEPQSPLWREKRSVVTRNLGPKMLDEKHAKVQEAESTIFMKNIMDHPDKVFDYARLYTASVAAVLVYGERAPTLDSFFNKAFYDFMEQWLEAIEPGANPPIEIIPALWYMPGKWKKRAYTVRDKMDKIWEEARSKVDRRRERGERRDCLMEQKMDEYEKKGWPMSRHAFNNLGGELLEAGADTTANMILTLILAFAKYPEVQIKARKELDQAVGTERTPVFSDFDKLPYINCIIKEALRWRPTSDLGLPHMVSQDDYYDGMLIPKGSVIWVGIWAMHQNEDLYADHEVFNPDRFLQHPKLANEYAVGGDSEGRDHYGYGAGRRLCPGIHLAERSMWRVAAKLLWAFEFAEPIDPVTGNVIPLDVNAYTSANLVRPMEFKVRVKPRSEEHLKIMEGELAGAAVFLKQFE